MKKFHRFWHVLLLTFFLMCGTVLITEGAEGAPGQTVSVTFSFDAIRGMDGVFKFSDESILSDISYSSSFSGVRFNNNKVFYSTTIEGASEGTVTVTATIKADAAVGSNCTITLDDINITDADTNSVYSGSKSEVLSVVAKSVTNTASPTEPSQTKAPAGEDKPAPTDNNASSGNAVDNSVTSNNVSQPQTTASLDNNVDNSQKSTESSTVAPSSESNSVTLKSEESTAPKASEKVLKRADSDNVEPKKSSGSIWKILFWVSLLVNILLAGYLLWRHFRKSNDLADDDTPLVDYDIDDDYDDMN